MHSLELKTTDDDEEHTPHPKRAQYEVGDSHTTNSDELQSSTNGKEEEESGDHHLLEAQKTTSLHSSDVPERANFPRPSLDKFTDSEEEEETDSEIDDNLKAPLVHPQNKDESDSDTPTSPHIIYDESEEEEEEEEEASSSSSSSTSGSSSDSETSNDGLVVVDDAILEQDALIQKQLEEDEDAQVNNEGGGAGAGDGQEKLELLVQEDMGLFPEYGARVSLFFPHLPPPPPRHLKKKSVSGKGKAWSRTRVFMLFSLHRAKNKKIDWFISD